MENIPQHEGQRIRNRWDTHDIVDELSRLVVVFSPDGVKVLLPEPVHGSLEIIDVLIGPIVFC